MRRRHVLPAIGGLLLSALSCRSATEPAPLCVGPIQITASADAQPVFDWPTGCGINSLIVSTVPGPGAAAAVVWAFWLPDRPPIGPTVRYGSAPKGASTTVAARPLTPGKYQVYVSAMFGGDELSGDGRVNFTR